MKFLLVIMALGGYNANAPAISSIEMPTAAACQAAGAQIVNDLSDARSGEFGSYEHRAGPRHIRFTCVEVNP